MRNLESITKELISLSNDTLKWLDRYDDEITRAGHSDAVRKVRRGLKKVLNVTGKKPSVAIFGQSQVGKSYLVQNLTKPKDELYLKIHVEGKEPLDFLKDINPEGGGSESSGVVTRFTVSKRDDADAKFPISVELFGELDVAAILTNGYLSDIKRKKDASIPSVEELNEMFADLIEDKPIDSAIDSDDVSNFVEYVKDSFDTSLLIHELEGIGYFSELVDYLPRISSDNRWKVLSLLWGGNDFLTSLYTKLVVGLDKVGFEKNISVAESALTPNDKTIIGIALNRDLLDVDLLKSDLVSVKSSNKEVELPRAVLAALTKEVELVAANDFTEDPSRSFFKDSDILDFPGSKSRVVAEESTFNEKPGEEKLQVWIRGKVAYLFDTYSANQGFSSLMFCLDNSPPEVADMPDRLEKWIGKYVGKGVEEREERIGEIQRILSDEGVTFSSISPLIVVLTKFNVNMSDVLPGNETNRASHDAKWDARLDENFKGIMNRTVSDEWIQNWISDNEPFNFVFPLRDPKYSTAIFDSDEHHRELGVRKNMVSAVESMGESFKSSKIVKELIADPKKIWSEISSPNGTGLVALCEALAPAAHPAVTRTRLESELRQARSRLVKILDSTGVSGDIEKDRVKAIKSGTRADITLSALSLASNRTVLSNILDALVIKESEIHNLLFNYKFRKSESESSVSAKVKPEKLIQDLALNPGIQLNHGDSKNTIIGKLKTAWNGLEVSELEEAFEEGFGLSVDQVADSLSERPEVASDRSGFTTEIISFWHQKLTQIVDQDKWFNRTTSKQREVFTLLLNELVNSIDRYDLNAELANLMNEIVPGPISDAHFELVSSCSASMLNKFIFSASWANTLVEERPKSKRGGEQYVFGNFPLPTYEVLSAFDGNHNWQRPFILDWTVGCKEMFEANVNHQHGFAGSLNIEASEKHGKIAASVAGIKL
jgi:hypothetical protein